MAEAIVVPPTPAPNGTPPPATPPTPATPPAPVGPSLADFSALMERVTKAEQLNEKLSKQLGETKDEAAQRRISEKNAQESAIAEARQKGELSVVVTGLEAKLKEETQERQRLAALEPDAKAYQKWVADETTAIETAAKALPPHWQVAMSAAATLEAKRAIMGAFTEEAKAKPPAPPPVDEKKQPASPAPPGGAPPGTPPVQVIDPRTATPAELQQLKAQNPDAYYLAIGGNPSAPVKKTGLMSKIFG